MAKNFEVGMILQAKGGKEAQKEIENVQKNIDNLRKKAIELNKEFKEKQSLKMDTKEVEQKLKDVNKQLGEERKLLGLLSEDAKRAGNELKALADRALLENLRDMSSILGGISSSVISFGKDLVSSAMQAENFKVALNTAFQGNQAAADKMLAWAKDFANATPFETNEIIEATIKLKAYGVEAEQIPRQLRLIGDMASGMGKSMNQAVEAIADARTGELERLKEFGITKKMIDDQLHGTLVDSKGQIKDMNLLMEGLTQIMEQRFAGGMERASKTTAGQISNLKGEFQSLKEELGSEVLPAVNDTVAGLTNLVKWTKELPPELKSTALTFAAWAGGIALAGQGITGLVAAAAPFSGVMSSLSAKIVTATGNTAALGAGMGAFGAALPIIAVGALVIAVGALANAYIEVLENEAKLKQNDISEDLKKRADALKGIANAGMEATNAQGAFNEITEKGVKALKEDAQGLDKVKATQKLLVDEEMRYKDLRTQGQKDLVSIEEQLQAAKRGTVQLVTDETGMTRQQITYDTERIKTLQQQYDEQKKVNDGYTDRIGKIQGERKELQGIRIEIEKNTTAEVTAQEKQKITDAILNKQISTVKNLYTAHKLTAEQIIKEIDSVKSSYDLMPEQSAKLDAWRAQLESKIEQGNKKTLQSYKENWNTFLSELKVALSAGEISQKQYNDNISTYLHEHASELQNSTDLKLKIEKEYYAGVSKLQKEQVKQAKEAEKERVKTIKDSWNNFLDELAIKLNQGEITQKQYTEAIKKYQQDNIQSIQKVSGLSLDIEKKYSQEVKKLRKEESEEVKKAAEEKKKINKEAEEAIAELTQSETEKKISAINKQIDALKKAGADEVKIQELTQKSIRKLQEETFQDFKQKEDQKRKEIEDTAKTIQSINDKIAANNQKIKDLESGSSFGTGSPLMSAEEALSKSFSNHLDPYIEKLEQSKALEQENQALMSERDKAFQKEQEQQSELKKIQEERNTAQDAFNTALQGTVDKYSAVSQTSPWEAEKKKIEEATAAAEKYNSVTSGGGEGSGSDADKKSGGGGDSGGGNQGNSSSGDKSPSTGNQNYIPPYTPQGQGGNNPGSSTQGQGGNLPSNYTGGGFSTNTSSIANPYAGQFGTGNAPQPPQPSANPSRSNQGWDWTPNYSTLGDLGSWGFDNPANDTMAFKAMEKMTSDFAIPVVTKSMKDMVMNMLGGMVSSVSNIVNTPSYSTTNSQVSNYKSTTNVTNYNTSLDNKQIATATPVERNVRELNSLIQKFRKPS